MTNALRVSLVLFVIWTLAPRSLFCGTALAQPSRSDSAAQADEKDDTAAARRQVRQDVKEAKPVTYYVRDKSGKLVPVLGFSFDQWQRLYQLDKKLKQPNKTPRFSLQSLLIQGVDEGNRAALDAEFEVLVRDNQWVRVPLRLGESVLLEPVRHEGPGEQFTDFDKDDREYVSWIRAPANSRHKLQLKLSAPVVRIGDEHRLSLSVPRSTVSKLTFTVPMDRAVGTVNEGVDLLAPRHGEIGRTTFSALGLAGDFYLGWHNAGTLPGPTRAVVEATAEVLVTFEEKRSIRSEALLHVRSFDGAIEQFFVRLPPGAKLVPENSNGYTVAVVNEKGPNDAGQDRSDVVEVKLARKTSEPVDVRLVTIATQNAVGPDKLIEVSGFEVVDAQFQSGYIALAVEPDWFVEWLEGENVRRVDELPETLRRDQETVVASFEYLRQPSSLKARVLRKKTRISVEPLYRLDVQADKVLLDATFKYQVRGANAYFLDVDMTDWQVDATEPEQLVNLDAVAMDRVQPLTIPLAGGSAAEFELRIRAHRETQPRSTTLRVSLPQPRADTVFPAIVVVLAADNVQLTPRPEQMTGFTLQQVPSHLILPQRQQPPFCYRDQPTTPRSPFVGDFQVRRRSVTLSTDTQVRLVKTGAQVQQTLLYDVSYEKLDSVKLRVPRSLAGPEKFAVLQGGQQLDTVLLGAADSGEAEGEAENVSVTLPDGEIGPFRLEIRYAVPFADLKPGQSTLQRIPLVVPADDDVEITANTLHITASDAVTFEPRQDEWEISEDPDSGRIQDRGLRLTTEKQPLGVEVQLTLKPAQNQGSTVIEKAWVRSWVMGGRRQDQVVYLLATSERWIQIELPPAIRPADVDAALGAGEVSPQVVSERAIRIDLHSFGERRQYLLRLSYPWPVARSAAGRLAVEVPEIVAARWTKRTYWQLIVPKDEYLLAGPGALTPELTRGWSGIYWGRRPRLSEESLRKWIGFATQAEPADLAPPEETNQYLYSTFGPLEPFDVQMKSRGRIVLTASGAALIVGLVFIYFPAFRHPAVFFLGAVALLSAAAIYPEPALLISQAAGLGLVLALVARLLERVMARRLHVRSVVRGSSASKRRGKINEMSFSRLEGSSQATTSPARVPVASPKSKS